MGVPNKKGVGLENPKINKWGDIIWNWRVMAYESSAIHLLTRVPYAGLYNYNGRKIELFHMK